MLVREGAAADRSAVDAFLTEHGAAQVARLGELVDAREHPALVAEDDGRLAGVLTYVVDGLRFYRRRGFRLAPLHLGAVDRSRATLKLEISETGDHGIPLRDELELHEDL
jgi:hypothetical protein